MEEIKHDAVDEFTAKLEEVIADFDAILPTEYANDERWRFIIASARLLCVAITKYPNEA